NIGKANTNRSRSFKYLDKSGGWITNEKRRGKQAKLIRSDISISGCCDSIRSDLRRINDKP
ncbi:unnamed protein product, partial [Rotaria sp. Silwood1]